MSLIFPLQGYSSRCIGLGIQREARFIFKVSKDFLYPDVQIEKKNNLKSACQSALKMYWFSSKYIARLCAEERDPFQGAFLKAIETKEHHVMLRTRQDTRHPNEQHNTTKYRGYPGSQCWGFTNKI